MSEALFDKVIGVNLKGPFRLSASIATKMAAGAGGSIINISSIEAVRPDATALPYAAAKAGLNALTLGLSHTFGPTVRTNTIQCGLFNTDIAAPGRGFAEALIPSIPLRRVGEPEDIVGARSTWRVRHPLLHVGDGRFV
ncbi:short chain dehydrogenase family protein [Mycobacteroides abscessus MAB_110811_2726]|nr:short chain dehydrogenase family protein [Mycobacteroides abscessus MAB_110811_2726]